MLEQFRILTAALRLREFGVAELARESGVAEETVRKTLNRKSEKFFTSEASVPSGRRGGQPKRFKVIEEVVRPLLQRRADEIDLPQAEDGLGAALAADTLCRVFPRVAADKRRFVLDTAGEHLETERRTVAADDGLRTLHRALSDLVSAQTWLLTFASPVKEKAARVTWLIEAVLSARETELRKKDQSYLRETAHFLNMLPIELLQLAKTSKEAPSAPFERWWFAIPDRIYAVLGNELWRDVAGDLADPTVLLAAVPARTLIEPATDMPIGIIGTSGSGMVAARALYEGIFSKGTVGKLPILPTTLDTPGYGKIVTYNTIDEIYGSSVGPSFGFDPETIARQLVRVHADYSRMEPVRVVGRTETTEIWNDASPGTPFTVTSLDFNFALWTLVGATVIPRSQAIGVALPPPQASESWLQFADLQFGDTNSARRLTIGMNAVFVVSPYAARLPRNFGALITRPDPHHGTFFPDYAGRSLQVRFSPGHQISVYEAAILDDNLIHEDAKTGEVWYLDVAMDTGAVIFAHMLQNNHHGLMIQVPTGDLRYDPERKRFVLVKIPGVSMNPAIAAAASKASDLRSDFH